MQKLFFLVLGNELLHCALVKGENARWFHSVFLAEVRARQAATRAYPVSFLATKLDQAAIEQVWWCIPRPAIDHPPALGKVVRGLAPIIGTAPLLTVPVHAKVAPELCHRIRRQLTEGNVVVVIGFSVVVCPPSRMLILSEHCKIVSRQRC